jgi:hypothetical protein
VAVDDSTDQHLVGRGSVRYGAAHQVERDRVDRRRLQDRERVVEGSVRRRDQDAQRAVGPEHLVRGLHRGEHLVARHLDRLADEGGLVELHPFGTGGRQLGEQLGVDGQQLRELAERPEVSGDAVGGLAQQKERDRADDDRARDEPGGLRLGDLVHQSFAGEAEHGVRPDLGHQVVVVGVEPLGHLERRLVALAARDREVSGEVDASVVVGEVCETLGDRADGDRRIQNLVVVGERLGDRRVGPAETQARQALARGRTQAGRDLLELGGGDVVLPEGLDGALELASAADAGVAQDRSGREGAGGGVGHAWILVVSRLRGSKRPTPPRTASGASERLNV